MQWGGYCRKTLKNHGIKICLKTNFLFWILVFQNMTSFLSVNISTDVSDELVVCIFTVPTNSPVFEDKAPCPSTNIHQKLRWPIAKFETHSTTVRTSVSQMCCCQPWAVTEVAAYCFFVKLVHFGQLANSKFSRKKRINSLSNFSRNKESGKRKIRCCSACSLKAQHGLWLDD